MLAFTLRDVTVDDVGELIDIGSASGLFTPAEADALLGQSLRGCVDGSRPRATHVARVACSADRSRVGWTYLSADETSDGVWELWWIGVAREAEGAGAGSALLLDAEAIAAAAGARILLISTSSTGATARARAFYERKGYTRCGQVPDFYADGDDKVIYSKRFVIGTPPEAPSSPAMDAPAAS